MTEYTEDYFDHDMGPVSLRYAIQQSGELVQITLTVEGHDLTYLPPLALHDSVLASGPSPEGDGRRRRVFRANGIVEKAYPDRPLVLIRLENGAPQYLDLASRRLVRADLLRERRQVPGFDAARDDHWLAALEVLRAMARLVVPAPDRHAEAGAPRLRFEPHPGMLTVHVEGLPKWQWIWFQHQPVEPTRREVATVDFGASCPPEHHDAMRGLIAGLEVPA